MNEHEQQVGQVNVERLRASMAVARRLGRYYEPVPLGELEALLAAADGESPPGGPISE